MLMVGPLFAGRPWLIQRSGRILPHAAAHNSRQPTWALIRRRSRCPERSSRLSHSCHPRLHGARLLSRRDLCCSATQADLSPEWSRQELPAGAYSSPSLSRPAGVAACSCLPYSSIMNSSSRVTGVCQKACTAGLCRHPAICRALRSTPAWESLARYSSSIADPGFQPETADLPHTPCQTRWQRSSHTSMLLGSLCTVALLSCPARTCRPATSTMGGHSWGLGWRCPEGSSTPLSRQRFGGTRSGSMQRCLGCLTFLSSFQSGRRRVHQRGCGRRTGASQAFGHLRLAVPGCSPLGQTTVRSSAPACRHLRLQASATQHKILQVQTCPHCFPAEWAQLSASC